MTDQVVEEWLDRLVGRWLLTGRMGETDLRQDVTADRVLGGRFVQMRCVSPGYEAIYHLGHDSEAGRVVFHLLDSTSVSSECQVGLGTLEADSVAFLFDYPSGPFVNRFTYFRADDRWRHDLGDLEQGELRPFATKHLVRA